MKARIFTRDSKQDIIVRFTYPLAGRPAAVILVLCSSLSLGACSTQSSAGADASLETDDAKASYSIGVNVGQNLVPVAERIDRDAFMRGLNESLTEADLALTPEEMQGILQSFSTELQQAQMAATSELAEANLTEGGAFLETNAQRAGVTTTESGLQYEVLEPADGPKPAPDDEIVVHYRGTLTDGTVFDSSYDRGEPATFSVGGVIPGFAEGLQLMSVGSKYKLFIPAELGYGTQDRGTIPPNSTLVFEVEMLEIK
jgi:FKBP-type peptidyl-prolyl cis-trans isomerase